MPRSNLTTTPQMKVLVLRTGDQALGVRCIDCRSHTPVARDNGEPLPLRSNSAQFVHRCVWCGQKNLYHGGDIVRFTIELPGLH
jgi:hypothetical protein